VRGGVDARQRNAVDRPEGEGLTESRDKARGVMDRPRQADIRERCERGRKGDLSDVGPGGFKESTHHDWNRGWRAYGGEWGGITEGRRQRHCAAGGGHISIPAWAGKESERRCQNGGTKRNYL